MALKAQRLYKIKVSGGWKWMCIRCTNYHQPPGEPQQKDSTWICEFCELMPGAGEPRKPFVINY